ncbi:phasin family protein [Paenibacillus lupini]|uniref:phasin family protein n=1 Tax=Paenibacillus lupini TaxID=1450204 RepID=UPI001FB9C93D|nr:polyhydroxyalkanoate synthesis regulator [Paenibacillus lupini]NIK24649.1 polyhydroxyalkanoate synthesis regulator phasin [Paenibacillus lupini]
MRKAKKDYSLIPPDFTDNGSLAQVDDCNRAKLHKLDIFHNGWLGVITVKDLFGRAVSFGLGFAVTSKEQLEKLADEWVKKGEITKAESSVYVDELLKKGEETRNKIEEMIRDRVQAIVGERYVTREQYEQLEQRVVALEHKETPVD